MHRTARRIFPYAGLLIVGAALAWAVSFGTLPPADFVFINGTDPKSVDPHRVTGVPEHRIISAIFEGLYRQTPDPEGSLALTLEGAAAVGHELSADGKTYTFHLRPEARWTNGDPVTAHDFAWSWQRMLHPETAAEYAYQLYYVRNAERYNTGRVEPGDRVEIELPDRPAPDQNFPRGTVLGGVLRHIEKPPEPQLAGDLTAAQRDRRLADWRAAWVYEVEVKPGQGDAVDWSAPGGVRRFVKISPYQARRQTVAGDAASGDRAAAAATGEAEPCLGVLRHFSDVGVRAEDERTLIVTLENPTPYFLELTAFYPLYPVHRATVEAHGVPDWTKPWNIVTNGPYQLEMRRIRDRIRLRKNPGHWGADAVQLEVIDALAVESDTTQLNLYENGQVDWATTVPTTVVPLLRDREDFVSATMLTIYYYRLNVTRPPLDDVRVRRALGQAMDKQMICDEVVQAGQTPARSFVPPGMAGYVSPLCAPYDVEEARRQLAAAGFPGGRGFPRIEILYNTSEAHRDIAEVIQQQWSRSLGVVVGLKNLEWQTYLSACQMMQYDIARAGWVGDYADPNTFLNMWVTDGPNNQTGWSHPEFDRLIQQATAEADPQRRLAMLHDAEAILMDAWDEVGDDALRRRLAAERAADPKAGGLPMIPIYYYVSVNLVRPYVKGFTPNLQDVHPLHRLRIDPEEKAAYLRERGLR